MATIERDAVLKPADILFIAKSAPTANGRQPLAGEQQWTFTFQLEDGRVLGLVMGREGRDDFRGALLLEDLDDAADAAMAAL